MEIFHKSTGMTYKNRIKTRNEKANNLDLINIANSTINNESNDFNMTTEMKNLNNLYKEVFQGDFERKMLNNTKKASLKIGCIDILTKTDINKKISKV